MREFRTDGYVKGVQSKLPSEEIEKEAASDALNWLSVDGRIELARGRISVGAEGEEGGIYGGIIATRRDGTTVKFRKTDTQVQYFDGTLWQVTVSGLTAASTYTFSDYHSLAGAYVYATGIDGIFKIATANPASYKNMFYSNPGGIGSDSSSDNYCGYSAIIDRRMVLWHKEKDSSGGGIPNYTTLFLSNIDPQDGNNYIEGGTSSIGTGNGTQKTFTGTFNVPSTGQYRNAFGFGVKAYSSSTYVNSTPTAVSAGPLAVVTMNTTGFTVGKWAYFQNLGGMTQLNGVMAQVVLVTPTAISIDYDTTGFTPFTSGGTVTQYDQPVLDDYNGGFTGATGTINYSTGQISVTFATAPASGLPVIVTSLYEDSNVNGITDFSTDDASDYTQGTAITQEYRGEPIQNVLLFEGGLYSFKKTCVYELIPAADWSTYTNDIFRSDIGIPSLRSAVSTGQGMVYMDTANPSKPFLSILRRSTIGGNLSPDNLTPKFAWEDYSFEETCVVDTWGENIVVSARTATSATNDRTMLVNVNQKYSVDVSYYGANLFLKELEYLYIGSPTRDTLFSVFDGFDDLGMPLENLWKGKSENYGNDGLKKARYLQFRGRISRSQSFGIHVSYDNGAFELVGTVRGDQSYVDLTSPGTIGFSMLGNESIGGGTSETVYPYLCQVKVRTPKYRTRRIMIVAEGIGYASVEWQKDFDILIFEDRIPGKYRTRQYVSRDGTQTDLPNFQ